MANNRVIMEMPATLEQRHSESKGTDYKCLVLHLPNGREKIIFLKFDQVDFLEYVASTLPAKS